MERGKAMSEMRPELSPKNKYWVEKHRYYELKHFCMQYPIWKKIYNSYDSLSKAPATSMIFEDRTLISDPVGRCVENREFYINRMKLIEDTATKTDTEIGPYILKGVTMGVGYDYLKLHDNVPCCKDVYYDLYRKFFWLLDHSRM